MKTLNREAFLKMPAGVLFTLPEHSDIFVKGETTGDTFLVHLWMVFRVVGRPEDIRMEMVQNSREQMLFKDDQAPHTFQVFEQNEFENYLHLLLQSEEAYRSLEL